MPSTDKTAVGGSLADRGGGAREARLRPVTAGTRGVTEGWGGREAAIRHGKLVPQALHCGKVSGHDAAGAQGKCTLQQQQKLPSQQPSVHLGR